MYLEVNIQFIPVHNDSYHDCIRIHSEVIFVYGLIKLIEAAEFSY